jgi:tetratricopeptide (TPR) repeat protein
MREQAKYHVALGCAFADRAASLAQATYDRQQFATDQAKYREWLAFWEAAQKDRNSPTYGNPRPEPPTLLTKDDHLPFVLTRGEASSQFKTLVKDAITEWETALSLSKTPPERAEIDYVQGWGQELLRVYGESAQWKDLPDAAENTRLILEATKLSPKNPLYWQSLGDMHMDISIGLKQGRDKPNALLAYRQALSLKKTNANLWYRVYDMCKQDDLEQAKEALHKAAQADPDNAYPSYRLAGLLLGETAFSNYDKEILRVVHAREMLSGDKLRAIGKQILNSPDYGKMRQSAETALAIVDQGNHTSQYVAPIYAPPFPALLKAAWYLRGSSSLDNTTSIIDWHTISVAVGGYIRVTALQGEKEAPIHAAHVLIDMGGKIAGDLYKKPMPLDPADRYRLSTGLSIARTGYEWLVTAFKEAGDSANAAQFDPEYQAYKARQAQYWEADKKARQNSYGQ